MARKVTFTLDEETIRRLQSASERLRKPKSEVVREAIGEYHDRVGRMSDVERQRFLTVIPRACAYHSAPIRTRRGQRDRGNPGGTPRRRAQRQPVILIDTSALIDALCQPQRSLKRLIAFGESGERLAIPTVVLYEWLRGPRSSEELRFQEELFPREQR